MSLFWKTLLPNTPAGRPYNIIGQGEVLQKNKELLFAAIQAQHVSPPTTLHGLLIAMAMIETRTMSVSERDRSKDGATDGSACYSIFNLSEDFLRFIGFSGDLADLNLASSLPAVVFEIVYGAQRLGVDRFLNFVRGGRMGYLDGASFGVKDYRSTVATILSVLDMQPSLVTDDRRVEINATVRA